MSERGLTSDERAEQARAYLHFCIAAEADRAQAEIRALAAYHRRCHAQRVRRTFEQLRRDWNR